MRMRSRFTFNRKQQSGIVILVVLIIALQLAYFFMDLSPKHQTRPHNAEIAYFQAQVDSLKQLALDARRPRLFPFNPNFITDHKGYTLGMSVEEIDRLHAFRAKNNYVNSAQEFQQLTKVSDAWLDSISPYFKFPDWVIEREARKRTSAAKAAIVQREAAVILKKDLNTATAEELRVVKGIGEKLSARIVNYRKRLGGFLSEAQLYEVYYLEPEVAERVLEYFELQSKPSIEKLDINTAGISELAKIPYLNYSQAREIVIYRSKVGQITSFDELHKNIESIPSEKIDRIALYLNIE